MHTILTIFLILSYIENTKSGCLVSLLDDINNPTKKLAFINEAEKENLDHSIGTISPDHSYDTLATTCDMLKQGAVAILGPQTEVNSQIVQSICHRKDILHVETRWNENPQTSRFTVNLFPHASTFSQALADLVEAKKWETFAIFYDDNESLSRISGILKTKRDCAISVKQLDVDDTANYRPILRKAWKDGYTHFVIDCHTDRLKDILKQAQQIGLMTSKNSYIITNPDLQTIDLEPYKYSDTNITGVRMVDPEADATLRLAESINDRRRSMEVYEEYVLPNEIRLETALLADAVHLLSLALKELPNDSECSSVALCNNDLSWHDGATALGYLKSHSFEGVTGLVQLNPEGYRDDFELQIIELQEDGLKKIATWNIDGKLKLLNVDDDVENLQNNNFVVITTLTDPYAMLRESPKPLTGNDRFEGFVIDLIHELSLIERFNYTFIIREDKSNGDKNKDTGKWSGMIGDIINEIADLGISDLTITSERDEAVDFTTPFMNLGISILYRKPSKASPNFFSFASPYAIEVWIWIGVAYFIVSISLFIMARLCPSEWTNPYPCVENPEYLINQLSLRNSFWFMLGSVLQQGSDIAPVAYATRMTAGSWWFFTLIIVSTYTANLAAFLTTESSDVPFNDVYELLAKAQKTGIKYGAKAKGATMAFFRDSINEDFHEIYRYMIVNEDEVMVADNRLGVERADKERYAFFMESVSIEYEVQRHCNLTQVGDMLDEKGYGIAMRKNSTYRHKLNTAVLKLQENGRISELKRKWWEERKGGGQCTGETKTDQAPALTLKNVGGVFWVTVTGTLLATGLVFVEMILHIVKGSIKHKKPFCAELKKEMKFYVKFRGLVKPVREKEESENRESVELKEFDQEEDHVFGRLPDIAN